jgi:hypothetical protein
MTADIAALQALPEPEDANVLAAGELALRPCDAGGTCSHSCWWTCWWTD